ncbi:MAG: glycogen-debranching protein [Chlamydiae bacterium]|nr:glycogen-debranching protein [Chlamydiota bacterium]
MFEHYNIGRGYESPLGVSFSGNKTNFSLFSENATEVTLCLFASATDTPFFEVQLSPDVHKTGPIWHVEIENIPKHTVYAYRVDGPNSESEGHIFDAKNYLLDPYAKSISSSHLWGKHHTDNTSYSPKGKIIYPSTFSWGKSKSPNRHLKDLIIYEMHVRGFTQDKSSNVKHPGTFLGVIEKIPYLKELGVNAIELLPVFEFNECENKNINPITNAHLTNFWGYSTVNFFSLMNRYAANGDWDSSINEFKEMVKKLHENDIEVILDVVYNHTSESGVTGPKYSFKGIDNKNYYILDEKGAYKNYSGTGNTFNCNHPFVKKLIVDSLEYFVTEMRVDGFRFDLASIFTRGTDGGVMDHPPLIEEILKSDKLKDKKLIAEAWDAAGLYQVGSFPGDGAFAEWNGKYRDHVRKFIKGTDSTSGSFATAICGSQDLYGEKSAPYNSINFITAHDGYSLTDLVSYQDKHNIANAENNTDGANDNESWNCGHEGETKNHQILDLRQKQKYNFMLALMLSVGTPMILMGDEYGHTRHGNNNPYCQDNELNWMLWDHIKKNKHFFDYVKFLIQFRKDHKHLFCRTTFLSNDEITWHGKTPLEANWDPSSRLVCYTMRDPSGNDLYVAFNADFQPVKLMLPETKKNHHWYKVIDTAEKNKIYHFTDTEHQHAEKYVYKMEPYSAVVLKSLSKGPISI